MREIKFRAWDKKNKVDMQIEKHEYQMKYLKLMRRKINRRIRCEYVTLQRIERKKNRLAKELKRE